VKIVAVTCLLACCAASAFSQETTDLVAKRRLYQPVGPGLRAVKRGADGNYYVLSAPATAVLVFDRSGKAVKKIPSYEATQGPQSAELTAITFGEDVDIDGSGTIYVADRGANAIKIWEAGGSARMFSVKNPVSVAVLPEGEVAVATLEEPHLVIVFSKGGKEEREFGAPEQLTERADLNRFLNIGQLATDAQGHLYYAFSYLPEPTVRQFDSAGYGGEDIQYTAIDAMPAAQARRKEIERQERRKDHPVFRRILTAVGVDQANGEVWMALGNSLLHFDKEGNRRATYKIYTPELARLEASTLLIEPDHLIIGNDPLGIYEFERPDKK
jgi:hypothetical protein